MKTTNGKISTMPITKGDGTPPRGRFQSPPPMRMILTPTRPQKGIGSRFPFDRQDGINPLSFGCIPSER